METSVVESWAEALSTKEKAVERFKLTPDMVKNKTPLRLRCGGVVVLDQWIGFEGPFVAGCDCQTWIKDGGFYENVPTPFDIIGYADSLPTEPKEKEPEWAMLDGDKKVQVLARHERYAWAIEADGYRYSVLASRLKPLTAFEPPKELWAKFDKEGKPALCGTAFDLEAVRYIRADLNGESRC